MKYIHLFFFGKIKQLQNKNKFQKLIDDLYSKNWLVFSKPSFANPEFEEWAKAFDKTNQKYKNTLKELAK